MCSLILNEKKSYFVISSTMPTFNDSVEEDFRKHCVKRIIFNTGNHGVIYRIKDKTILNFVGTSFFLLSSKNALNLVRSKSFSSCTELRQTTNFRFFQKEKVYRRQLYISCKRQKVLQKGIKHCRKMRNCSLRAISPFPLCFQKTCIADT